jgi:hypothetical protein
MKAFLMSVGVCLLLFLGSCARAQESQGDVTLTADEIQAILNVIKKPEEAANEADSTKLELNRMKPQ